MEIGDLMRLTIGGAVWWFQLSFGEYRKLLEKLEKMQAEGDPIKVLDEQLQLLRERVVKVEGLTKGGEPVEWDPSMVDDFSPLQIKEILGDLMALGEAETPTTSAA